VTKDELIHEIAGLIAGLQVPRSLGGRMLGTATEHWDALHINLVGFGWSDADAYEKKLKEILVTNDDFYS
jgi:hypothetical protein